MIDCKVFRCVLASQYRGLSIHLSVRLSETYSVFCLFLQMENELKWLELIYMYLNNRHNDHNLYDNHDSHNDHNKTKKIRRRVFVRQNLLYLTSTYQGLTATGMFNCDWWR